VPGASVGGAGGRVKIIGLDLSLRSTGIASDGWADRIVPAASLRGLARLRHIRTAVLDHARSADLVVVEGPSYGSTGAGQHERAGLWWLVFDVLAEADLPVAVVPPACRCRYATGRGNASKDQVLAAVIRRYPDVDVDGNDQADAYVLAAMGYDHAGQPLAPVPATHHIGLAGCAWPPEVAW
jgi:crossover junction endodeoxyribonuclease RuvC